MILLVYNTLNFLEKYHWSISNFFYLPHIQTGKFITFLYKKLTNYFKYIYFFLHRQQNKITNGPENIESPTKTPLPYIPTYQRTGCMAAFESFDQFEQYFDEILDIMEDLSTPVYVSPKIIDALESGSESRLSSSLNVSLSLADGPRPDQENVQVI